jgi:pyrophosphatase PpaX
MIKAFLFDLDGTLRQSNELISSAIIAALKENGITAELEDFRHAIHNHREVFAMYADKADEAKLEQSYFKHIVELEFEISLYAGVEDVLKVLKDKGYKLGIVSSARRASKAINEFGLSKYFDAIIGGNDTARHKPHPEPIFAVTQTLDIRADEAVMVGDLPADIISATSAGCAATVGILHGFGTKQELLDAGADYIIENLSGFLPLLDKIQTKK